MSEELIARWMDDRSGLSEEEAAELARVLAADPALARQVKDQLATDEILSRHLAVDRRHFEAQVAQRIVGAGTDGSFLRSTLDRVRERRGRGLPWRGRLPEAAAAAILIVGLFLILWRGNPSLISTPAALPRPVLRGLRAQYYRGAELRGPAVDRIDSTVDFFWPAGQPPLEAPRDLYSVRWTGKLTPKVSDRTTLHARYDDGIRVWIGGKLILDDWTGRYVIMDRRADVDLVAGQPVDLRIEYFNGGDRGVMQLFWSSPRQPEEIIPGSALSHE
ncbi:MAG TPA: PA14 domain-containing protein [Planctomycetota bacterium]|nr:PA14 domain-containing protein [Planctomycetota bacterium]